MCDFVCSNGSRCSENNVEGKTFCYLHQPFPLEKAAEYNLISDGKARRVQEKIRNNDFDFEGAHLTNFEYPYISELINANFHRTIFYDNTSFHGLTFRGKTIFSNSVFKKCASFSYSTFQDETYFDEALFSKTVLFHETVFENKVCFFKTEFFMDVQFWLTTFKNDTAFFRTRFKGLALFDESKFLGKTWFNKADICDVASFKNAEFDNEVYFIAAKPEGPIFLEKSTFKLIGSKEAAYRFAKLAFESLGDREKADCCFYQEMAAKRTQKLEMFSYPEFIVAQLVFGYGVKPARTFFCWLFVIFSYAIAYYNLQSLKDENSFSSYLFFSLYNSISPGFNSFTLKTSFDQLLAGSEAIIGTFLLAAFVVIFARKYMRS